MNTVIFNGYNLNDQDNGIYAVRVQHGSFAERDIDMMQIGREDGLAMIDAKFNQKVIPIEISIHKSNEDDLTTALSTIKEYLSGIDKDLILQGEDDTIALVYKATVKSMNEIRYDKFTAKLQVDFYAPLGRAKSQTQSTNAFDNITDWQYQDTVTISGSYNAKPVIRITFTDAGTCDSIQFTNTTTNTQIQVDHASTFATGDILIIDCENKTVTLNGVDYNFDGVFPLFVKGSNNFMINFFGDSIGIDQLQETSDSDEFIDANDDRIAQGFKPTSTADCPKIDLLMNKTWTPKSTDNEYMSGAQNADRRIALDSTGRIYGHISNYLSYSDDDGVTWNYISFGSGNGSSEIALDSSDDVHIIYRKSDLSYAYRKYDSSAGTLGGEETIHAANTYARTDIVIAIDSSDEVHVLYLIEDFSHGLIYNRRNAGAWDQEANIAEYTTYGGIANIAMVIDSSDYKHAFWTKISGSVIYYSKRTASWSGAVSIASGTKINGKISVVLDSSDNLFVSYIDYLSGSGYAAAVLRYSGGAWQAVDLLTDYSSVSSQYCSIASSIDREDVVTVIYRLSSSSIYYRRRYIDDAWDTALVISGKTGFFPRLSMPFARWPVISTVQTGILESGYIYLSENGLSSEFAAIYLYPDIIVQIQTDSAGDPSGTAVANAEKKINIDSISSSLSWVGFLFATAPNLTTATQYHIVLRVMFGAYSTDRNIVWRHNSAGGYADGLIKTSPDAGSNWTDVTGEDACFKTYLGGTADQDADLSINYYANYL